jgi:DNA-binding HxlR family transcriptional regulator
MAGKRHYNDSCGIARALDLVGERWALLVVRELIHGPKRFTDLRAGLPGVSPDVLAQRLRELEAASIVERATLPPPASVRVYALTEWGAGLEPVLIALGRFGSRTPLPPTPSPLSVDATVMMLQTTYRPPDADRPRLRSGLVLDGDRFELVAGGPELVARRGEAREPATTIDTDPATLTAALFHDGPRDRLRITGDPRAAAELLAMFERPAPLAPDG